MRDVRVALVVLVLAAGSCAGAVSTRTWEASVERAPGAANPPVAELAGGLNNAGFDLLRTQPAGENAVVSPLSIGNAALMLRAAADNATRGSIDRAFGLPDGLGAHEAWNFIDQQIRRDTTTLVTVTIADRIWPNLDTTPNQEWVDLLSAQHGATVEALDLQGAPEASRRHINGWIAGQTNGLIDGALPQGFIGPDTVLVLTDALYFKARWERVFGKYGPIQGTFTRLDGSTVDVEFLQEFELGDLRGTGDGYVAAEIPYARSRFSMLVIVPDQFTDFRDQLTQDILDQIDASLTTGPYEVLIPRWEATTNIDLVEWFTQLGVAPGSYPAISPDAFIDGAIHAADITVDESGTVAAAVTAAGFEESGPPEPEVTLRADRPYLYLIRHRPTGTILFAGQVTNPTT